MKRLNQLPEIADELLAGIRADRDLLERAMAGRRRPGKPCVYLRRAVSLALSAAVVLGLAVGLGALVRHDDHAILTQAAGGLAQEGRVRALDVPRGSIRLVNTGKAPGYQGVWASGSGANFPMVRVQGRYYRLLTNPTSAGDSAGRELGQVAVHTQEPALDASDIVSNVVPAGSAVHEVAGMRGAAVAAPVDGVMRVFQRVSFGGNALIGSEGLGGTLGPAGSVTALQLSGVGTVTDSSQIANLLNILLRSAAYQGSGSRATGQALLIQYGNGIVLQMAVKGSSLSACGTWACPEFIEAFAAAVR